MGLIIGFTGAFGSGCSTIIDRFLVEQREYVKFSLSAILKQKFQEEYDREPYDREELQNYGNAFREFDPEYLANIAIESIEKIMNQPNVNVAVDSIRNPLEINAFRRKYPNFLLFAVFADYETRWGRVKNSYNGSKDAFDRDDFRDQGNNEPAYGQNVTDCFFEADLILSNNQTINFSSHNQAWNDMDKRINNYLQAFDEPTASEPLIKESLMAIAYAIGRRSKCLRRRVGAIIVDKNHNILSSGFNAVPGSLEDCQQLYGECYRHVYKKRLKDTITNDIRNKTPEDTAWGSIFAETFALDITNRIKALELCRALHAEESAILNLVGTAGQVNFSDCTLYASTFPCNLCANKIAQLGIGRVVYFEPYPVQEAKEIFDAAKIKTEPFEGITFRAFFRAFNYAP